MVFLLYRKERDDMQFTTILEELEITKFRKKIEREIETYFEKMGYSIIEPKIFQDYDDFIYSNIRQDSSKTVKVLGGDSRIYILRPDITPNILKQIFSKWEGKSPLKIYYNSKVYRNEKGGKILENYQMGIESLGDGVLKADREVLEMAISLMSTLGEPYILELGSSKYLDGFLKEINLDMDDELELRDLISKKNRDGLSKKLKSLKLKNTILDKIFHMQGSMDRVINIAKTYEMNEEMRDAIGSLEKINEFFLGKDVYNKIQLDLSMVPDFDYYDGVIFKGYCLSVPRKILSGGRYDKSTKRMGREVPAIGFMIDMDLVTRIRIKGEK